MSRGKVWWEVKWDVPTFSKSPGRLEYIELVKAPNPQIALWKASKRFVEKMQWVLENKKKSIGGTETGVRILVGDPKQADRFVRNHSNDRTSRSATRVLIELNPEIQFGLDQINSEFIHDHDCSKTCLLTWYQRKGIEGNSIYRIDTVVKECSDCGAVKKTMLHLKVV